ncbi:MAG: hypothetical protein O3B95_10040, partial [Chloroflexi bacterium]|nr:hypothetical protein [Chloroflexota bacterium]
MKRLLIAQTDSEEDRSRQGAPDSNVDLPVQEVSTNTDEVQSGPASDSDESDWRTATEEELRQAGIDPAALVGLQQSGTVSVTKRSGWLELFP